jgi:hypothetical protein
MSKIDTIYLGLTIGLIVGCKGSPSFSDRFTMAEYRLTFSERLRFEITAPVIVLGRVTKVNEIGKPRHSPGDSRILTQLTEIELTVEDTMHGDIRDGRLAFYYFTYSSQNTTDLGVPRYIPEVGQRRIYFLTRDGNTYRSIGDVTNYNLPVRSGIHSSEPCRGTPGCCIAEVLLVPGKDVDIGAFATYLDQDAYAASTLCSPQKARELLEQLMNYPDKRIANQAREVLELDGEEGTRPWITH